MKGLIGMLDFLTPDQVIRELQRIQAESSKAPQAIFDAELKLAEAERNAEVTLQKAFIAAQGTIADRTAVSRLQASDARFEADVAKAELNRVKAKAKQLADAGVLVSVMGRQVELALR
jgi:hypothetical protein